MTEVYRTTFFNKTRRGKLSKIVRETYCHETSNGSGFHCGRFLSNHDFIGILKSSTHKRVVVLDTNIVLHHIDALELVSAATELVVVAQTLLLELRNQNYSIYKRFIQLLNDPKRMFLFFPNDHEIVTKCLRSSHQSINDSNDAKIVQTAMYYSSLIDNEGKVVFVSNDLGNRERAIEKGIFTFNFQGFLSFYSQDDSNIADYLASSSYVSKSNLPWMIHISSEEAKAGLSAGKYLKGILRTKANDTNDCYVVVSNTSVRTVVQVKGLQNVNRALEGDTVVLELLENQQNKVDGKNEHGNESDLFEIEGIARDNLPLEGRVITILRRSSDQYAGSIDPESIVVPSSEVELPSALFTPVNKRLPKIWINSKRLESMVDLRLLVVIDNWPMDSAHPVGHVVKVLGKKGDKITESEIILHEFGVPHETFTAEVMACLPPDGWTISEKDMHHRSDFRRLPIASVDPPGCKDIDDALHCIKLPNGHYQVGVHIADVGYFVLPDSPLDLEAAKRCTSTYLVEKRLDMLPSLLTTQLCSLRSDEDHLAFSVLWEMDENANIFDVQFKKSIIRSVASLTYDQAQMILDGNSSPNESLNQSIRMLNHFAKILRKTRNDNGALTLVSPEVRFKLDEDSRDPTDVMMYNLKEANAMVEEWMLLANITVAKKILKHYPTLSILRRHQPPSIDQLRPLQLSAKAVGFNLNLSNSKSLSDSLDAAVMPEDPYFNKLLRIIATRCMMPAQYFCSGELTKDAWHHYGLATPVYTHFTSPIRRYADVLVHRLLAAAIGVASLPSSNADRTKQREICATMNRRHRMAQYAQRSSVSLYTIIYFSNRVSEEEAYVLGVRSEALDLLIPRIGVEKDVDFSSISSTLQAPMFTVDLENCFVAFRNAANQEINRIKIFQKLKVALNVVESGGEKAIECKVVL